MEITSRYRGYFVSKNGRITLKTNNRQKRKILARLDLLPSTQQIDVEVELSAAQIARLKQVLFPRKIRTRHPRPKEIIQIYHNRPVMGNDRRVVYLARGTTVEILYISQQIAKLIQAPVEKRQDLDGRAAFMMNEQGRLGFMFYVTNHFVPLKLIPDYTRFKILKVPSAQFPESGPELTISLEIIPQKQA